MSIKQFKFGTYKLVKQKKTLTGNTNIVFALTELQDGRKPAVVSIKQFEFGTYKLVKQKKTLTNNTNIVFALTVLEDRS